MESMDILQLMNAFLPATGFGGTVTTVHEVSKRLVKRGHQVTIATTDMITLHSRKPGLKRSECVDGIFVKRFPAYLRYHHYFFTPKMVKEIMRENPDIVHGTGARNFQSDLGALFAHRTGIPYVLSGYGSLIYYGVGDTFAKALYDGLTLKLLIKMAIRFIAQSGVECKAAMSYGILKERIRLIPTGTDLKEFSTGRSEELIEKYGLNRFDADSIILFVGRINPIKGLEFLFKSFSQLIRDRQFSRVLFLIVGEDQNYWAHLQSLPSFKEIKPHLVWLSKPSRRDIINAYHLADIFVLTSVFEHCPHVIHEAGACKLPVIATRVGGIPGVIRDGETGLLIEYDNINQLVSRIKMLLTDKNLRNRLGQALFVQTEKKYSWDVVTRKHEQLYKSIAL